MKYFLDTKFIEDGKTIDLISIGIVVEDGRELYLGNIDCNFAKASDWIIENVLIPMGFMRMPNSKTTWSEGFMRPIDPLFWVKKTKITEAVKNFCNPEVYGKPEFWAYYADYDWVIFCQLFGAMIDLPKGYPMYCRDIKQLCDSLGNPKLPEQKNGEHNALEDARWNKQAYEYLSKIKVN